MGVWYCVLVTEKQHSLHYAESEPGMGYPLEIIASVFCEIFSYCVLRKQELCWVCEKKIHPYLNEGKEKQSIFLCANRHNVIRNTQDMAKATLLRRTFVASCRHNNISRVLSLCMCVPYFKRYTFILQSSYIIKK